MVDKVLQNDLTSNVSNGGQLALLTNDIKRAVNEIIEGPVSDIGDVLDSSEATKSILLGDETESFTLDGEVIPSVKKSVKDNYDGIQAMVDGQIPYATLALAQAAGEPPTDASGNHKLYRVVGDPTSDNNGLYYWDGSALVKSPYDPISAAQSYTDAATDAAADDLLAALDGVGITQHVIGASSIVSGSVALAGSFVLAEQAPEGKLTSLDWYNPGSSADIIVKTFSRNGDVFTETHSHTITVPPGASKTALNMTVESGEYLGVYAPLNSLAYIADADDTPYYAEVGADVATFTDATVSNGVRLMLKFTVMAVAPAAAAALSASQDSTAAIATLSTSTDARIAAARQSVTVNTMPRNLEFDGNFRASFAEFAIGIKQGADTVAGDELLSVRAFLSGSATATRFSAMLYAASSSTPNGADTALWDDWVDVTPVDDVENHHLYEFASPDQVQVSGDMWLVVRAFDASDNRVNIGCGRAPADDNYDQVQRGAYRAKTTGGWFGINASAALAVGMRIDRLVSEIVTDERKPATRIFGGRTEYPFDNTTKNTFRTIFTLASEFDAVRVIFAASNSAIEIGQSAIAALPTADYSCANADWKMLTFSGAESGVGSLKTGPKRRSLLVSDWIDLESLSRTDDADALPLLAVSALLDNAATVDLIGNPADSFVSWVTHPTRPHVMRATPGNHVANPAGNHVANPAGFTSTANITTSPVIGVQYKHRGSVVSVMATGDSITDGRGESFLMANWAFKDISSRPDFGSKFEYSNIAWSGATMPAIATQTDDMFEVDVIPDVLFFPVASPNGLPTPLSASDFSNVKPYALEIMNRALRHDVTPIAWTMLPVNPEVKDYNASDQHRIDYNQSWLDAANNGAAGFVVADFAAALSGDIDADGQTNMLAGSTTDNIHPNDSGETTLSAVSRRALNAVLKTGVVE